MEEKQYRKLLVQRYVENKCTQEELEVFFSLLRTGVLNEYLEDDMSSFYQVHDIQDHKARRRAGIRWLRYVAAAAILIVIVSGILFSLNKFNDKQDALPKGLSADIEAPDANRAMIKLSNGQIVYLDSSSNGELAKQGDVKIEKLVDGRIVYNGSTTELTLNSIINPRGSKVINMTLADGSRVWLNAGSSLIYPVAFIGKERNVTITGEAYFEVARNKELPFVVQANGIDIEVLGTHFNINAYSEEAAIQTTLLEGSVKVSKHGQPSGALMLQPGQQANAVPSANIRLVEHADLEQIMAWKNGLFQFRKADIQTIMRQVSCWYDVDVVYEGEVPKDKFSGNLPRDSKLSVILSALEQSQVHFRIEGRKIIVMP